MVLRGESPLLFRILAKVEPIDLRAVSDSAESSGIMPSQYGENQPFDDPHVFPVDSC